MIRFQTIWLLKPSTSQLYWLLTLHITHVKRITLNGGPGGLGAVLPNEKHEFSAGWRAAQKSGSAGCTAGPDSGLHIKAGWWAAQYAGLRKRAAGGLAFSAARQTSFLCSRPARPSVFCAARRKFRFFIWKHGPPICVIL